MLYSKMCIQTIFFKDPVARPGKLPGINAGEDAAELGEKEERHILCRQCLNMITGPDERTWMSGGHRHTFANPVGVVYEIGCFNAAPGCRAVGPASDEFAWFPGYLWRIVICSKCLTHLGWYFLSSAGHGFHGLILDRLIEQEKQD